MVFNWAQYEPVTYASYVYPPWGTAIGWILASMSLVCIPLGMIKAVVEARGSSCYQVRLRCYSGGVKGSSPMVKCIQHIVVTRIYFTCLSIPLHVGPIVVGGA